MVLLAALAVLFPPSPYSAVLPGCAYLRADPDGAGSAWVVNAEKKWLLTCRHVVGEQTRVEVFFPVSDRGQLRTARAEYLADRTALRASGHLVVGKVLKTSDELDLALVEVPSLPEGAKALPLANSRPTTGLPVWAIGHRGDVETLFNLSSGVVRQRGRIADGFFWQAKTLLKNAPGLVVQLPIAEGESGAPMVTYHGEVVGVVSAFRNRVPSATFGPDAGSVRKFLEDPTPAPLSPGGRGVGGEGDSVSSRLARSTVWIRPTATDTSTAGVVIDLERRWVLTNAAGLGLGLGPYDRVGVAFPLMAEGGVVGERDTYRDPVELHLRKAWFPGTVLLRDAARDLAIIELDDLPAKTLAITIAIDDLKPGEKVHSISHPTGLEFAFVYSAGTVKQCGKVALGRNTPKVDAVLLQLPGQGNAAGGPVASRNGQIAGVLSAKETPNQQAVYAASSSEVRAFLAKAHVEAMLQPLLRVWHCREWLVRRAVLLRAVANIPSERWNAALDDLDAVLEAEPLNRSALLFRAGIWRTKKEPKKAIADLQRLLDFDPADVLVRSVYAEAFAESGDTDRAAKERANVAKLKR